MAKKKKHKGKKLSKTTSWGSFEKYIDRLFNWAYDSKTNRYDKINKKRNEIPKHIITKENTMKIYSSQVKQYCKWVYSTKGETNLRLRFFKKKWYEEYLNERYGKENSQDISISSVHTSNCSSYKV
jgi:recombinational DNA repair ATPase RecF